MQPEIRSGRLSKVYAHYPFLVDRGYFSSGSGFDLKTVFNGLLTLHINYKQLPEVSANIKTISMQTELRSGRLFFVCW